MSANVPLRERILPVREREHLKASVQIAEADERGDSPEFSRGDKKHIINSPGQTMGLVNQRDMKIKKDVLKKGEPPNLTEGERVRLENEEKRLVQWCSSRMLSRKAVQVQPQTNGVANPEFNRNANLMAKNEHSQEFLSKAHRLKQIRKALRPQDPDAGNLEFIRPD